MSNQVEKLHGRAMELASQADRLAGAVPRAQLRDSAAVALYRKAFELEKKAATGLASRLRLEPTRSILYRSAASLALLIGEKREAEKLIFAGLAGHPPDEIAEELRSLWEECNFERHLPVQNFKLAPQEFLLSMYGSAVGPGFARCDDVITRVHQTERLMYRTAERLVGKAYRERGSPSSDITDRYGVFVSPPKMAASLVFAFRIGGMYEQIPLFGAGPSQVVDDMISCVEMLGNGSVEDLRRKISDEDYFTNFVGLADQIAGRNDGISVGFATVDGSKVRRVEVRVHQRARAVTAKTKRGESQEQPFDVVGELRFADATKQSKGIIEVLGEGVDETIQVPRGLMSDVVRPYFEKQVHITGVTRGGKKWLQTISEVHG